MSAGNRRKGVICTFCGGTGKTEGGTVILGGSGIMEIHKCPKCNGRGWIDTRKPSDFIR